MTLDVYRGRKTTMQHGQLLCVSFFPFWCWGWVVGCDCINFWSLPFYLLCLELKSPLRQYFSLYRSLSKTERKENRNYGLEKKNIQTVQTRKHCKHSKPLPYTIQIGRTPRHWQSTIASLLIPPMHHPYYIWLVGWFGLNGSLSEYFSLYRDVSQREEERKEKWLKWEKNVQITPTRTYCKHSRPLPIIIQISRTPRHWKFAQRCRTPNRPRTHPHNNWLLL